MPDFQIRRAVLGGRREGRRSLSAYGSHARGTRVFEGVQRVARGRRRRKSVLVVAEDQTETRLGAAGALALVYPLVRRMRRAFGTDAANRKVRPPQSGLEGAGMKRKPSIRSLETVSLDEAMAYLEHANGDELSAAYALAWDRNRLDGSHAPPDDAEVHHALFLLCRTRGRHPPSFDEMRVELRRRRAAA